MTRHSLSIWDAVQLALLRCLSTALALVDEALNVHWGEHLLDHLARRWQGQLDQINESLTSLERERSQLEQQMEAMALQAAAVHLGSRHIARHGLRFDPSDPKDERVLDASIDVLVRQRLAAIEPEEVEPGHYVYHLEPDWCAIRARLADAAEDARPEIADWLREGVRFVDEAFLTGSQT